MNVHDPASRREDPLARPLPAGERWSPTTTSRRGSTPTTSGSARRVGIAERRRADPDETVADMAERRGEQGAGGQRARRRRDDRPRRRRDLHDADTAPRRAAPRWPPGSASPRPARTTSTPPAPASATRLPRPGRDPRRAGPQRARDRRGEAHRLARPERPADVHHLRRRRRRRGRRAPARRRPSARSSGAATAAQSTASPSTLATRYIRQEGQAVFRWATTALAPVALEACERAGDRARRPGGVRAAPGQPAHHRGASPAARRCRRGRRRDIVDIGQHLRGVDPAGAVPDGRARRGPVRRTRCCCSASASGLTYAGQVVLAP